jgi:hypothetical protein
MKLKLDDKGAAVLQDGKPVYLKDDGSEIAFDAAGTVATISRLNGEAKSHRERAEEAENKLKGFEGIEDPAAARKALETVKGLDAKKLIDAGEVDKVKAEISKGYEAKIADLTSQIALKDKTIHSEKIGGAFARSKFIADKIAIPVDMVQAAFGKHFALKDDKVIATGPDGNQLYSKSRIGEPADFEEALELLVDAYPHKATILKAPDANGSGKQPGGGGGTGQKVYTTAEFNKLNPKDRAGAMASGAQLKD